MDASEGLEQEGLEQNGTIDEVGGAGHAECRIASPGERMKC
jgi:hypothetical protein